jgi:hypothetical protein
MERLNETDVEGDGTLTDLLDLLHTALADSGEQASGEGEAHDALESLNIKDILLGPISQLDTLYSDWLENHSESSSPQFSNQARIIRNLKTRLENSLFNENQPDDQDFVMENLKEVKTYKCWRKIDNCELTYELATRIGRSASRDHGADGMWESKLRIFGRCLQSSMK